MLIWHRGVIAASRTLGEKSLPLADFLVHLEEQSIPRVPGTAIFLTRTLSGTPPVMKWHVKRNGSLHANVLSLHITIVNEPRVANAERLVMRQQSPGFWCGVASYGFMERPNIPRLLHHAEAQKTGLNFDDATYYLGLETVVRREANDRLPAWQRNIFALMVRNGMHVTDYYYLPSDQVVEISRRVPV
ncbi:potassium transport protein Kup [compost metagenome]